MKDRQSTGLYCLPRLQEIVMPVATAIMVYQLKNTFPWHSRLQNLKQDTHMSSLLKDF